MGFPRFFGFLFILILGGPAKSLPELFFFVFFCFLKVFLVFSSYVFFILYAYLSVFFGFDCGTDAFT